MKDATANTDRPAAGKSSAIHTHFWGVVGGIAGSLIGFTLNGVLAGFIGGAIGIVLCWSIARAASDKSNRQMNV
jgi:hypothetical protein